MSKKNERELTKSNEEYFKKNKEYFKSISSKKFKSKTWEQRIR